MTDPNVPPPRDPEDRPEVVHHTTINNRATDTNVDLDVDLPEAPSLPAPELPDLPPVEPPSVPDPTPAPAN